MDAELGRFFEHWVAMLRGERGAQEVQSALGESSSSIADLSFYRTLMQRNATNILSALYPATRAACLRWAPGQWLAACADFDRAHPARHFDPNEFGRDFSAFLGDRASLPVDLRMLLGELADYEWLSYAFGAGIGAETTKGAALERHALRQYDHDVPALVQDARAGTLESRRATPVTVLCYRDPATSQARAIYPSRAALIAIAQRSSLAPPLTLTIGSEDIARAERELEALGVLKTSKTLATTDDSSRSP